MPYYPEIQFPQYQPIIGRAVGMYERGQEAGRAQTAFDQHQADRQTLEELLPQLAADAETVSLTNPKTGEKVSLPAQAARAKLAQLDPRAFAALNAARERRESAGQRDAGAKLIGAMAPPRRASPMIGNPPDTDISLPTEAPPEVFRMQAESSAVPETMIGAAQDYVRQGGPIQNAAALVEHSYRRGKEAEDERLKANEVKYTSFAPGSLVIGAGKGGEVVSRFQVPDRTKEATADQTTWALLDEDGRVKDIQYGVASRPGPGYEQWGVAKTLVSDATRREVESIRDTSRRDVEGLRAENRASLAELRAGLRPESVSDIGKLIRERDALPEGHPNRKAYDEAIAAKGPKSTILLNDADQADMERLVDMVGQGKMNPDRIGSRNPKFMTAFWGRLTEKYPEYNAIEAGANASMARNAQLNRSVMILDSIQEVMGDFAKSNEAMGLSPYPAWNKAKLLWMEQTGDPKYTEFVNWRNSLGQELANALSGAAATDMRIKMELENMKTAASPAQFKAAYDVLEKTVRARLEAFRSKPYPTALGGGAAPAIGAPADAKDPLGLRRR